MAVPMAIWQQILAVDARYNVCRTPNNPQNRTLYIRRRSQLLQGNVQQYQNHADVSIRRQYLIMRHRLLAFCYGTLCLSDGSSLRSRTASLKSSRLVLNESCESGGPAAAGQISPKSIRTRHGISGDLSEVVPTYAAEASRAMVGHTTIGESYAFAGMHHIFDQHTAAVTSLKFATNDKSRLACSSLDGTLSVCQVEPAPATVVCRLVGHESGVTDLQWSISNDLLVSSSLDATVRLWSVAQGNCLRVVPDPVSAPVLCVAFHPFNNNMLITGNNKGFIQASNVSTGIFFKDGSAKTSGQVFSLVFDSKGKILWAGDNHGTIHSYKFDCETGRISKCKRICVKQGRPITCMSSRDWMTREAKDPSVLVNCADNVLCLFRVTDSSGGLELRRCFHVKHRSKHIRSSFCPIMSFRQGACVVTGSEDMCVYFFDATKESKPCVNKLQGHSSPVLDVCFNYDESLLASSDESGLVIVWKRELL